MRRLTTAAVALVAAVGIIALAPSHPAHAVPVPDGPRPGLGDDVYLYRPILQSVPQAAPLDTLIRFRMEAYTNFHPRTLHIVVHLYRWRSAAQLKRPKGAWVEIHPTKTYGITALPAVGTHDYLKPPAEWTCETGRFYVKVKGYGIMHNGKPDSVTAYFPWSGYTKKNLDKGNVHKPPSLKQAWRTSCQGHDEAIG